MANQAQTVDRTESGGTRSEVTGWVGWVAFAGVMLILDGIFQAIIGLTALFNNQVYLVTSKTLVAFNITTWGWVHMLIGLALVLVGLSLFSGSMAGRVIAVFLAGLSAIANLAFVGVYPLWSLVVITVDILVMYALIVHGGEVKVMD